MLATKRGPGMESRAALQDLCRHANIEHVGICEDLLLGRIRGCEFCSSCPGLSKRPWSWATLQ
eukprot:503688-Lingulodinium_polyedra.AAC.1